MLVSLISFSISFFFYVNHGYTNDELTVELTLWGYNSLTEFNTQKLYFKQIRKHFYNPSLFSIHQFYVKAFKLSGMEEEKKELI